MGERWGERHKRQLRENNPRIRGDKRWGAQLANDRQKGRDGNWDQEKGKDAKVDQSACKCTWKRGVLVTRNSKCNVPHRF